MPNQKYVLITPFILDNKTIGVIEIGKFTDFSGTEKEFITVSMVIAISVNTVLQSEEKKKKRAARVSYCQQQNWHFQNEERKKEPLNAYRVKNYPIKRENFRFNRNRQLNEELEQQTQNLKQQQEELQMTNDELEEQTPLEEKKRS
jgi:hypothetical protein